MIKKLILFCSVIFLAIVTGWGQSTNRLVFASAGFSIAPLEAPPGESARQALVMCLPASDGFAPNVNVLIQPYAGTIQEFTDLSLQQLKSGGFKLLQPTSPGKSEVTFEYTGIAQGRALHWYGRARKSGGMVYLATATAADGQWVSVNSRLKACVDSLRCDAGD